VSGAAGPPRGSPGSTRGLELLAYAIVGVGFVLMLLGIFEIGGLFNIAIGFAAVWIGGLLILSAERRRRRRVEDDLMRRLEDL
jgi:hypothetical protein